MSRITHPQREGAVAEGAMKTVVRGIKLSPELRIGLPLTVVLALVATAGRAIVPVAVQRTIDNGLAGTGVNLDAVLEAVILAGVAVLVTVVASAWMNVRLVTVVETALAALRTRAFRHIHDLSMLHQATEQRGSLTARVTTDVDEISRFMSSAGLNLLTAAGQIVIATVVMAVYSWQLTLVVLATFIPFVFAARWFQRRLTVAHQKVRGRLGAMLGRLAETVVGAPVIRAYGTEQRTQAQLDEAIERHRSAGVAAGRLTSVFSGSGEVFAGVATSALVVAGVAFGTGFADVSPGTVVAFLFLITLFVEPVLVATEVVNEGQTAVAGWRRVLDVLDVEPDVADPADGVDIPAGPIGVAFEAVRFRYPKFGQTAAQASGPEVLRDINVTIRPHSKVAVVGETGSGKTTFAKLLVRLMDPSHGQVRIGGAGVQTVRFASLRRRVVMVPQEGALFDGSIAHNVRHGEPSASNAQLTEAFAQLGLADWIAELPDGLETQVGERGAALSAGERQLVALARAYVADPDLLVLDEATSAVDPATEVRLQRALAGLTHDRTTVTIAHRLSTARAADEVLVFDQGQLVQRGPHRTLVDEPDGVYARLHRSWVAGTGSAQGPLVDHKGT